MIPFLRRDGSVARFGIAAACTAWLVGAGLLSSAGEAAPVLAPAPPAPPAPPVAPAPPTAAATGCLVSGDGYLRARIAGAVNATIDWPNSGTRCQGESKRGPPGIRLSFQRDASPPPDLLFVFGLTGVRAGLPAREAGANLTVIVQGTTQIYGTLGDSRCTVDSLSQKALPARGAYRVEARGFCTQPAHAVRGSGEVLVSTFEFAGLVNYDAEDQPDAAAPGRTAAAARPFVLRD